MVQLQGLLNISAGRDLIFTPPEWIALLFGNNAVGNGLIENGPQIPQVNALGGFGDTAFLRPLLVLIQENNGDIGKADITPERHQRVIATVIGDSRS